MIGHKIIRRHHPRLAVDGVTLDVPANLTSSLQAPAQHPYDRLPIETAELMLGDELPCTCLLPRYCLGARFLDNAGEFAFMLIVGLGKCRYGLNRPCC
ncbi:hypothetical protein CN933_24790 [Sinorhizobium sp. M4_45]|nr:hypothetical protein CN933_24790 [Sinorhizobium sp. M4_45]